MRSELQDHIEQKVGDIKGNRRLLCCSILMLSHGVPATISELSTPHCVRLDQVLLLSSCKVTLVFTHEENQAKVYREIQVADLPHLREQGVHLQLEPFLESDTRSGQMRAW